MATAQWIKNMIEQRGVPYEALHHPEVFRAQEVAECERVSGHRLAKVVVALADGRPVELILPASRRVVLERVRELLGANEIRLASEAEMERLFTDCEVGAVPPLPHGAGVLALMDASMRVDGDIWFQAGTREDVVRLKFEDWLPLVNPRIESFSQAEHVFHAPTFRDREDRGTTPEEG